jgi:hypothetical protein
LQAISIICILSTVEDILTFLSANAEARYILIAVVPMVTFELLQIPGLDVLTDNSFDNFGHIGFVLILFLADEVMINMGEVCLFRSFICSLSLLRTIFPPFLALRHVSFGKFGHSKLIFLVPPQAAAYLLPLGE